MLFWWFFQFRKHSYGLTAASDFSYHLRRSLHLEEAWLADQCFYSFIKLTVEPFIASELSPQKNML